MASVTPELGTPLPATDDTLHEWQILLLYYETLAATIYNWLSFIYNNNPFFQM